MDKLERLFLSLLETPKPQDVAKTKLNLGRIFEQSSTFKLRSTKVWVAKAQKFGVSQPGTREMSG